MSSMEQAPHSDVVFEDDDDVSEDDHNWDDWEVQENGVVGDDDGDDAFDSKMLCLFCEALHDSTRSLFEHCSYAHRFDFYGMKTRFGLDFYSCFKLINYVRSKVAENKCWSCGILCQSKSDLLNHLHEMNNDDGSAFSWNNDVYLKPFMEDDTVLFSFAEEDEDEAEGEITMSVDEVKLLRDMNDFERISINDEDGMNCEFSGNGSLPENRPEVVASVANGLQKSNGLHVKSKDNHLRVESAKSSADAVKKINKNYFDSYSSFGIHREMISDKVRTDAYRQAIIGNPSLLKDSVVMDLGCGTGILSLFAAQAGASRVIAVEASQRMAAFAKQIAKDNGLLRIENPAEGSNNCTGVMEVAQGMVEDLVNTSNIPPHSVDVLISEWMGYCLLYESMLSSVLFARDRWLKPGGALLPDTATIFVAGFGKGGTSIPFWENVYGLNMNCVAKEVVEDASHVPIVDVIDSRDIVTNTKVLQTFDLVTMKLEDMDFTAQTELEPIINTSVSTSSEPETTCCYGLVLWFDTGFTDRFCKESPTVLSTSPFTPKTHWSQTILTFREPIAMASGKVGGDVLAALGTDANPAARISSRISIARARQHRSIDISMELVGIGSDGRRHNRPAQLFNLS